MGERTPTHRSARRTIHDIQQAKQQDVEATNHLLRAARGQLNDGLHGPRAGLRVARVLQPRRQRLHLRVRDRQRSNGARPPLGRCLRRRVWRGREDAVAGARPERVGLLERGAQTVCVRAPIGVAASGDAQVPLAPAAVGAVLVALGRVGGVARGPRRRGDLHDGRWWPGSAPTVSAIAHPKPSTSRTAAVPDALGSARVKLLQGLDDLGQCLRARVKVGFVWRSTRRAPAETVP
jgi:hypothetical protein